MTIDERLDRIEHVTAGLDEERRKDREEARQLWRDTQRQLNELATRVTQNSEQIDELRGQIGEVDRRLAKQIEEVDKLLAARIENLVSAIGQFIAAERRPQRSQE